MRRPRQRALRPRPRQALLLLHAVFCRRQKPRQPHGGRPRPGAWRAATRCTVTGAGTVASTVSSRTPSAPTTAALPAAPAAPREVVEEGPARPYVREAVALASGRGRATTEWGGACARARAGPHWRHAAAARVSGRCGPCHRALAGSSRVRPTRRDAAARCAARLPAFPLPCRTPRWSRSATRSRPSWRPLRSGPPRCRWGLLGGGGVGAEWADVRPWPCRAASRVRDECRPRPSSLQGRLLWAAAARQGGGGAAGEQRATAACRSWGRGGAGEAVSGGCDGRRRCAGVGAALPHPHPQEETTKVMRDRSTLNEQVGAAPRLPRLLSHALALALALAPCRDVT